MKITHGKTKQELHYLNNLFIKLFEGKVDYNLETAIHAKFSSYMCHYDNLIYLENFVKVIFVLTAL